jgi:hypothetical protein
MAEGIRLTRVFQLLTFLVAALLVISCGGAGEAPADQTGGGEMAAGSAVTPQSQPAVERPAAPVDLAIEIANKIQADPDGVTEILEEYGMTEEELDQLLYEIAADPELRKIYNEATAR